MHRPVLIAPPAVLPVSVLEMRSHLHVDSGDDDERIADLIREATAHLDGWTGILGRCLVEQTWRQDYDAFARCLPLQLGPVMSVAGVGYTDADGEPATVDPGDYALRADGGGRSRVEFAAGLSVRGPVSVTYVAGFPTVGGTSTVPADVKGAIILYVRARYDPLGPADLAAGEQAFDSLIGKHRRVGL